MTQRSRYLSGAAVGLLCLIWDAARIALKTECRLGKETRFRLYCHAPHATLSQSKPSSQTAPQKSFGLSPSALVQLSQVEFKIQPGPSGT